MSVLEGFIRRQGKDDWKLYLLHFNDKNAGFFARHLIMLSSSNVSEISISNFLNS